MARFRGNRVFHLGVGELKSPPGKVPMKYQLRLFENGVEVSTQTVGAIPGGPNFPLVGDSIDGWIVKSGRAHGEHELWLEVERIQKE